jgi:YfiH family protein
MSFDRRALPEGGHVLVPTHLEREGFLIAFTERDGGVGAGAFASLNLSLVVGDDPSTVAENRRRVVAGLGVDRFACPEQVHGAVIAEVDRGRSGAGFDDPGSRLPRADGVATDIAGLPIAVLSADCLPIALASPRQGRLVLIHAGWRGLAAGIVAEAVATFEDPGDVLAAIGPAVAGHHYDVGEEVAAAVSRAVGDGRSVERRSGELRVDLPVAAITAMGATGVRRIANAGLCTVCEEARFFSHRRDVGLTVGVRTGRHGVVAVRLE